MAPGANSVTSGTPMRLRSSPPGTPAPPTTLSNPKARGGLRFSRPGTYTYSQVVRDTATPSNFPPDRGNFIVTVSRPAGKRQSFAQREHGDPSPITQTFEYAPTKWVAIRLETSAGGCNWTPPLVILQFPLQARASWLGSSDCRGTGGALVRQRTTVISHESTIVRGHGRLETWRIVTEMDASVTGVPGFTRLHTTDDREFAPALGVAARQTLTEVSYDGTHATSTKKSLRILVSY